MHQIMTMEGEVALLELFPYSLSFIDIGNKKSWLSIISNVVQSVSVHNKT